MGSVIDFGDARASRAPLSRFGYVIHEAGVVEINLAGRFTPAAARALARHIIERADAAERDGVSR